MTRKWKILLGITLMAIPVWMAVYYFAMVPSSPYPEAEGWGKLAQGFVVVAAIVVFGFPGLILTGMGLVAPRVGAPERGPYRKVGPRGLLVVGTIFILFAVFSLNSSVQAKILDIGDYIPFYISLGVGGIFLAAGLISWIRSVKSRNL